MTDDYLRSHTTILIFVYLKSSTLNGHKLYSKRRYQSTLTKDFFLIILSHQLPCSLEVFIYSNISTLYSTGILSVEKLS